MQREFKKLHEIIFTQTKKNKKQVINNFYKLWVVTYRKCVISNFENNKCICFVNTFEKELKLPQGMENKYIFLIFFYGFKPGKKNDTVSGFIQLFGHRSVIELSWVLELNKLLFLPNYAPWQ